VRLAAKIAVNAHVRHPPCHRATRDMEAFPDALQSDLVNAVDPPVQVGNAPYLAPQGVIATGAARQANAISVPLPKHRVGSRP
jgi:hypothetical protein